MRYLTPIPQACHECGHQYAGAICPLCKIERPAYTALKKMTARQHSGVQPLRATNACAYFPNSICGCDQRGLCLDAA